MATEYTPGPWHVAGQHSDHVWGKLPHGWVADCAPDGAGMPYVQANARLIAAAPDLLEACQGLTEIGRTQDGGIIVGPQGWDNLRAAIAKARGNDTP